MTISATDLAAMLCSRLCHDMLSPVGALSNGLELLAEERDGEMRARIVELLEQSAKASADKLKFFRLAFGAAGGFGELVSVAEPRALVEGLVSNNERITLSWNVSADAMPKAAVKVLLNLALFGMEALVRGGTLEVGAEINEGASEIAVRASGPRIAFDETVGRALDGTLPEEELSSRTAPAALVQALAREMGGGVQYALTSEALVLGAVLPGA
ncbi:histidine phosphotransferase family protein [Novosphingobium sp. TH158]|uniref:histidine phosphotransferase family protein n=1 Tax=Novosphingobium sp. TH158 TaxID=2067455 RepID=UPI000C7DEC08|nr:histidine phosphotransferase family protein [Novosphingobium sp. TH158]PLK27889.1 histidine phosphotransferase [Novosphingobium sp. TH158]